jgi:nitrogen-specific signal transduction histidine kinase
MERNLFGSENDKRSFDCSSAEDRIESIKSKLDFLSNEQNAPFLRSFFIDLIQRIKSNLASIKNYTQISRGKFSDREFGEYYYRAVNEDIEKMNMVLNSLLDYIKVHTPIRKTNTVHNIMEEVLKKHQAKLDEKGIKVLKKLEKDLPETVVPDEQLKYIFSSLLQYAVALTPPNWNLGLSTRSLILDDETTEVQSLFKRPGKYIEISVVFPGHQRPSEPVSGTATIPKEEASDLILRFVKELVLHNHGMMNIEADEKKTKTLISVRFPVERRKVVYYQTVN